MKPLETARKAVAIALTPWHPRARSYLAGTLRRRAPIRPRGLANAVNGSTLLGLFWVAAAFAFDRLRGHGRGRLGFDRATGLITLTGLGHPSLTVKGGTTVGSVFITPVDPAEVASTPGRTWEGLLEHERVHSQQWAALGVEMAVAYPLAYLLDGETNDFERQAGLTAGGYPTSRSQDGRSAPEVR